MLKYTRFKHRVIKCDVVFGDTKGISVNGR